MGSTKWNNIEEVINQSISVAEALRKMDLDPRGANYIKFKRMVKNKNLDISHFKGQAHGTTSNERIPWSKILVKDSEYEITVKRKSALIKDGLIDNVCKECGINTWRGKPITLHIDHINGDHCDNRIENLRFVCPNCHSQTETYCGKNHKKRRLSKYKRTKNTCVCGKDKAKTSSLCLECENKRKSNLSKIKWPSICDLKEMIASSNYTEVAKKLGVSDNAIRKHMRSYSEIPRSNH